MASDRLHSAFVSPKYEVSPYNVDAAMVVGVLATEGACLIEGPVHSGKTELLTETATKLRAINYDLLCINGINIARSADELNDAAAKVKAWTAKEDPSASRAVLVDHLDSIGEPFDNDVVTKARAGLLLALTPLAIPRPKGQVHHLPNLVVTRQTHESDLSERSVQVDEAMELLAAFSDAAVYSHKAKPQLIRKDEVLPQYPAPSSKDPETEAKLAEARRYSGLLKTLSRTGHFADTWSNV